MARAARWARRTSAADDRLARGLLGVLCLLMLASALKRLGLYVAARTPNSQNPLRVPN